MHISFSGTPSVSLCLGDANHPMPHLVLRWLAQLAFSACHRPRFQLDANVLRVPIIPGGDPRQLLGDMAERGVKGIVLEVTPAHSQQDLYVGAIAPAAGNHISLHHL